MAMTSSSTTLGRDGAKRLLKEADAVGLNRRLTLVVLLLGVLAAAAGFGPAGGIFRDIQAALVAGAMALFLVVAASGIPIRYNQAHLALAAFCAISLGAVTTSVWRVGSLLEVVLVAGYLIIFLTATNVVGKGRLRLAGHLLVGGTTLVTTGALYAHTIGYDRQIRELAAAGNAGLARQLANMIDRAFGSFPSANSFAGFLVLIIPVAVGLFLYEHDLKLRIWLGAAITMMTVALYLTYSKGGLIALAVGVAVMLYGGLTVRKGIRSPGRLVVPLLLTVGVLVYIFWTFFGFNAIAAIGNVSGRVELWRGAWRMFLDRPWLGVGPGNFGTEFTRYQAGAVFSNYAHNTYLQVAVEQGVLGLIAFLATMAAVLAWSWRRVRENQGGGQTLLRLGLVGGLAAFIVHNAVDYTWYIPGVAVSFWIIAGLAVASEREAANVGAQPTPARWAVVVAVGLGVIPVLLVYAGTSLTAQGDHFAQDLEVRDAKKAYGSALLFFPPNAAAHDGLARTVYIESVVKKRLPGPEAIAHQRQAVALRPTWPHYHQRLGDYLSLAGQREIALREYKQAIKLYPNDPAFKVALGNYLIRLRHYSDAVKVFQEATALTRIYHAEAWKPADLVTARGDAASPVSAIGTAYMGMAFAYVDLGRTDLARRALDKAEKVLGRGAEIQNIRARIDRNGAKAR